MNLGPDHLSRIESGEEPNNLDDNLPNAILFALTMFDDNYRDIIQFLSIGYMPVDLTLAQKKQLVTRAVDFELIAGQLYKLGLDEILRHCVLEHE